LRWLSSGPRCGLNEINLPPMQPGSSIMPGKVNPVIPELVNQICYQIIGYDTVISMAAEASELELNMAEPIIAYDLLHGMMILKNACITLTSRCIAGITANADRCRHYVESSIGLVTALKPGAWLREVRRHRQGSPQDRRQGLRPGVGEEVADQDPTGRSAEAGKHDGPAADFQMMIFTGTSLT
jgi:aspartate ammonia-lyase